MEWFKNIYINSLSQEKMTSIYVFFCVCASYKATSNHTESSWFFIFFSKASALSFKSLIWKNEKWFSASTFSTVFQIWREWEGKYVPMSYSANISNSFLLNYYYSLTWSCRDVSCEETFVNLVIITFIGGDRICLVWPEFYKKPT